ncbi:unnamed protein product, partial [Ectocarpus sp. 4 AP-2014]
LVEDKVSLEYLRYKNENDDEDPVDILVDVDLNKVKVSISKTIIKEEVKPAQEIKPAQEKRSYKIIVPRLEKIRKEEEAKAKLDLDKLLQQKQESN